MNQLNEGPGAVAVLPMGCLQDAPLEAVQWQEALLQPLAVRPAITDTH